MLLLIADLDLRAERLALGSALSLNVKTIEPVEAKPDPIDDALILSVFESVYALGAAPKQREEAAIEDPWPAYPKVPPYFCRVPEPAPTRRPRRRTEADGGFG